MCGCMGAWPRADSVHVCAMQGWDKTYCLQFVDEFETIHFFGDKTFPVSANICYVVMSLGAAPSCVVMFLA